jgi:hypothetical protein
VAPPGGCSISSDPQCGQNCRPYLSVSKTCWHLAHRAIIGGLLLVVGGATL